MSISAELDMDALLTPISEDSRGGRDFRQDDEDNEFREIKDLQSQALQEERQARDNGEVSASAEAGRLWQQVWDRGQVFLARQAKDLEIAGCMIQASMRLDGFTGLAAALSLTTKVIDEFWNELLPTPDEDGHETTLIPITRLDIEKTVETFLRVPVTLDLPSFDPLGLWQHESSKQLSGKSEEIQQEQKSKGFCTADQLQQAVLLTGQQNERFYADMIQGVQDAEAARQELSNLLERKLSQLDDPGDLLDEIGFGYFKKGLEQVANIIQALAADFLNKPAAENPDDGQEPEGETGGTTAVSAQRQPAGEIGSREDAFKLLEKIALWFEKHEPQSILPAEIRKAKRRGQLSPQQLYKDLIADDDVLRKVFKDVGIADSDDSSD